MDYAEARKALLELYKQRSPRYDHWGIDLTICSEMICPDCLHKGLIYSTWMRQGKRVILVECPCGYKRVSG